MFRTIGAKLAPVKRATNAAGRWLWRAVKKASLRTWRIAKIICRRRWRAMRARRARKRVSVSSGSTQVLVTVITIGVLVWYFLVKDFVTDVPGNRSEIAGGPWMEQGVLFSGLAVVVGIAILGVAYAMGYLWRTLAILAVLAIIAALALSGWTPWNRFDLSSLGSWDFSLESPSPKGIVDGVRKYWIIVAIVCFVLWLVVGLVPKVGAELRMAVMTVSVLLVLGVIWAAIWGGSAGGEAELRYQPMKHAANGDTVRMKGADGMVATFKGPSMIPYCVYQDSPGVYTQEAEHGPSRCDWKRLDYQYAHDTSGKADSIGVAWVRQPN